MTADWRDNALCSEVGGDLWFPENGMTNREAIRICMECPVRYQCLRTALDDGETEGIWGATTPNERRVLRRLVA